MKEVSRGGRFVSVGALRFVVPASVAHLCDPAGQLKSIHGLSPTDTCVCGELVSMDGCGRCEGCGRPYQRRCQTCESWVPSGDKVGGRWYEPTAQCSSCERDRQERSRRARLGSIPAPTREAAGAYRKRLEHRAIGDECLSDWLAGDCGRVMGAPFGVWLYGEHGVGKSTSAARAASHAVATGMVKTFMWTTSREILEAAKMRFIEGGGAYRALLDQARDVELLVIDEMWRNARSANGRVFGVEGATSNGLMVLSDIIRSRIDHRVPTLFTSKHPLDSVQRLLQDSTWHRVNAEVAEARLGSVDMRNE